MITKEEELAIFENILAQVNDYSEVLRKYSRAKSMLNMFQSIQETAPPPIVPQTQNNDTGIMPSPDTGQPISPMAGGNNTSIGQNLPL